METSCDTPRDAPSELDLFKAEIFGEDHSNDDDNHVTSGDATDGDHIEKNNGSINIGGSGGDDEVDVCSSKQKQQSVIDNNNGVVVIVTSPPPTDPDDDIIIYDDDTESSADTSRRSSSASGGDVTPQIEAFGLSSALSRVTVGSSSSMQNLKSPVTIHRINVTPRGSIVCDQLPLPTSGDDVIDAEIRSSLWQPMKPAYAPTNIVAAMMGQQYGGSSRSSSPGGSSVVIRRTQTVQRNIFMSEQESSFRLAIPVMPRYLAVVTAIMNVISPGLGQYRIN